MAKLSQYLPIGVVASRCGVAASALRFYESKGLISSVRASSNQRQFHRSVIRKVSVIKVAQKLGLSLEEIQNAFSNLPTDRAPGPRDWQRMSREWNDQLQQRIRTLQNLQEQLSDCIGCGCLSLKKCALYNPDDCAGKEGNGPRYLLEDDD